MEEKPQKVNLEIDIRKLINELWINRRLLIRAIAVALIIGLIIGFSIPREYTCTVRMAPEGSKSSITGDVGDLAALAGININAGEEDGIGLVLYPDVVQSLPFMYELMTMPLGNDQYENLYNYLDNVIRLPWWSAIVYGPLKLADKLFHKTEEIKTHSIDPYRLTRHQYRIFSRLKKRISVSIDKKNGTITAGVTMQDRILSAVVADSLVVKLEKYIINYRTSKAQQDLGFATNTFEDARKKYYDAQQRYARYVDQNKNIILESVLIEQERLKNEQSLAYNLYSSLAQQVEKARLKVQEKTPCITVFEPASIPTKRSNISKLTLLVVFSIAGGLGGTIWVMYANWNKINIQ